MFKWGRYQTEQGTESLDAAWACLNLRWHEERDLRIDIQLEEDQRHSQRPQKQPGDKLVLQQDGRKELYSGLVWRSDEQWSSQEDHTVIEITAAVNPEHSIRQCYQQ